MAGVARATAIARAEPQPDLGERRGRQPQPAAPALGLGDERRLSLALEIKPVDRLIVEPTHENIRKFAWETLNSGQVVPGYGHAVLRVTDPRFTCFRDFGMKHFPDDPIMKAVNIVFEVVPDVLQQHGKAKNPWPNVDAGSGALLYHYGIKEFSFYTVFFAVSRALGMASQLVINRAMATPIERPKSVTTTWIKKQVNA